MSSCCRITQRRKHYKLNTIKTSGCLLIFVTCSWKTLLSFPLTAFHNYLDIVLAPLKQDGVKRRDTAPLLSRESISIGQNNYTNYNWSRHLGKRKEKTFPQHMRSVWKVSSHFKYFKNKPEETLLRMCEQILFSRFIQSISKRCESVTVHCVIDACAVNMHQIVLETGTLVRTYPNIQEGSRVWFNVWSPDKMFLLTMQTSQRIHWKWPKF